MGEKVVIGKVSNFEKKPVSTWRDWKKREGRFLVIAIFGGGKYPNGAITFDEGEILVRKTLDLDVAKELIKKFRGFKGDLILEITKDEDGFMLELDPVEGENGFFYNLEGRNLIRRKEDIPF